MDEKSRETWEVSLAFLQNHRKVMTIGARLAVSLSQASLRH
jgi:hypothetical protein